MPSSTSNSEQADARRALAILLCVLALICIAMEFTGSFAFARVSRIQRRIEAEYKEALRVGPISADGKPTMLVVGNSLLLEGLDLPRLQSEIGSRYQARTFFVEQTQYMDWYYGLKRFFHEGSRPKIVLLGLSTNHLAVAGVRGEYFAHFMMRPIDAPHVASQLHLDATTASNYFFASLSGWLGAKSEIRKWMLIRAMPDLDAVANLVRPGPPHLPASDTLKKIITSNLLALKQVCDANGSRLIIVVPSTQDKNDQYLIDQAAGSAAGVPVLVPLIPGELGPSDYRDGFHLNAHGAAVFTDALAGGLLRTL
jgi:hypothetical protein